MEQIMQMQDDIHKLKKMMDSVFEKIESHSPDSAYDAADAYADKDRIVEMLNRLSSRVRELLPGLCRVNNNISFCASFAQLLSMADADMSNLTATPTKDATPEDIASMLILILTLSAALLVDGGCWYCDAQELKQTINNTEAERQSIYRRAGASLKGVL